MCIRDRIYTLGTENHDSDKWEEIGSRTFSLFEQAERVSDEIDEDLLTIAIASILLTEYPDLIANDDSTIMRNLLREVKSREDPLVRIQASQSLKIITDDYPILINLFSVKMASEKASQTNPTDGHRLLQMHDQIVNHFRNRQKDQAFTLLEEAIDLRDQYDLSLIHI